MRKLRVVLNYPFKKIPSIYRSYRRLRPRNQIIVAVLTLILLISIVLLLQPKSDAGNELSYERAVTVESIAVLQGGEGSVTGIGTVRSVTEANILAQSSGTVTRVNTNIGGNVGAGAILAELENASERASVLQAEGVYDAAVSNRENNSTDIVTTVKNVYQSSFTTLDTSIENYVDLFYGNPTAYGPDLLIFADSDTSIDLARARNDVRDRMNVWRSHISKAEFGNPRALLTEAESTIIFVSEFLIDLAKEATNSNSGATTAQLAGLTTARETVASLTSTITSTKDAYEAQESTGVTQEISAADAQVKQALGTLRLAQANLEKTMVRAPIGGTVNFLPIRVGDYVSNLTHVATVAQNGALEIVAYVAESARNVAVPGEKVLIEGEFEGVITLVSPALNPTTKQIEVHVALSASPNSTRTLVNGESVQISFLSAAPVETPTGPTLLPLKSVKLRTNDRVVFTVDSENRIVAIPVQTGVVRGDKIEILTTLPFDLRIVTDARGLVEGERVEVLTP